MREPGGPVTVKGQTFNNAMLPWRDVLTDEEIAQVLTYVRKSWGNDAPPVPAPQVTAVRSETAKHRGSNWTAAELEQVKLKQ